MKLNVKNKFSLGGNSAVQMKAGKAVYRVKVKMFSLTRTSPQILCEKKENDRRRVLN